MREVKLFLLVVQLLFKDISHMGLEFRNIAKKEVAVFTRP